MRANVEFTASEKQALQTLTGEEREAVIDQMLERVREDIEWAIALDQARLTAAASSCTAAPNEVRRTLPPPIPANRPRRAA
jgi:hypothetical protein